MIFKTMPKSELILLFGWVLIIVSQASPVNRHAGGQNTLHLHVSNQSYTEQNVCVNDDVLYQPGDLMPAPNPCSRCVCSPPGSQCMPVSCEKKPGCKALIRPNQCCPEYQCECERNGRLYQNGERLDNADNPCEACYCQGGEVVCTTVECYKRDDCEPQYVKGKCCPKYDHCPPLATDDAHHSSQPAVDQTRPHHTRSTFQPESPSDSADVDPLHQSIGASNIQQRVHISEVIATDATQTPEDKLMPSPPSDSAHKNLHAPPHANIAEDKTVSSSAPTLTHDGERGGPTIKIDIPAVPWTEPTKEATVPHYSDLSLASQHDGSGDDENQTVDSNADQGSGMTEIETPMMKSQNEDMIREIEHITEVIEMKVNTLPSTTEEISIEGTTKSEMFGDDISNVDEKTERVADVTETTEEETDSTTFSSGYTGIHDEMITSPEPISDRGDVTETHGIVLSSEALLHATMPANQHILESSTDSSPEFKYFDEWSDTKSSDFQRDSSSFSSSAFSTSSESNLKHSKTSSDESSSHVLATNINLEKVKLTLQSEGNSVLRSSSQESTTSEESDNTEGSANTEVVDSVASESTQINHGEEQTNLMTNVADIIRVKSNGEKSENEHNINKGKDTNSGHLNIVLDTEATDQNGPPILLIGDELANHQMDIIVATTPSAYLEYVTDISSTVKSEERLKGKVTSVEQKNQQEMIIETTTEKFAVTTSAIDTSNEEDAVIVKGNAIESQTEDIIFSDIAAITTDITEPGTDLTTMYQKSKESNTEKLLSYESQDDVMLRNDPLSGQIASSDNIHNFGSILSETKQEAKKESENYYKIKGDATDVTIMTTLVVGFTTDSSTEKKNTDLRTESPDHESSTNTVVTDDVGTTETSQHDTSTSNNGDSVRIISNEGKEVPDRRVDLSVDIITESATANPSTISNTESVIVMYDATERSNVEDNVPNILDEKQNPLNIKKTQQDAKHPQLMVNTKNIDSSQKTENPSEDITATTSIENFSITERYTSNKGDNVKNFAHEEMLLGDQPQTIDSALIFGPVRAAHEKERNEEEKERNEEEKERNEEFIENKTEMNLESAIIHEEIHNSESEGIIEAMQNVKEATPDLTDKSDNQTPSTEQNSGALNIAQDSPNSLSDFTSDNIHQVELHMENTPIPRREMTIQAHTENQKENLAHLDHISGISKISNSEELATPPPDTTLVSVNGYIEETTTVSENSLKTVDQKEENSAVKEKLQETTTLRGITDKQTNAMITEKDQDTTEEEYKINPEILQLKPTNLIPLWNTTEVNQETDSTTLSPGWLKKDNETKLVSSQQKEKVDEEMEVGSTEGESLEPTMQAIEGADEVTDKSPVVSTLRSLLVGEAGDQLTDKKKRLDDADKDLFVLEDFFTKLYRHQLATDETKH